MEKKQVFHNAKWIVACKIAQSLLQLVVGMLCARYLGPSNYGLIGYATSVTAFFLPVMKLGFDATLVSELIREPEKEGEILGTSLAFNLLSSLLCMAGVFAFVWTMNAGEWIVILVCVLYSLSMVCAALEMSQYWFQYKLLSKYSSVVMLVAYVLVSAYRICLLVFQKSVYWFALTNAIDYGIIGIALLVLYHKLGEQRLSFNFGRGMKMLGRSRYYILASMMIIVIQNTDHIMITTMVSEAENGYYSAAITCATLAQFVYTAVIDSFRPMILAERAKDPAAYENSIAGLYSIIVYVSAAQSAVFILFAELLIRIMYGAAYMAAVPVLRILMCYIIFSQMGTVRNVWILAEEKQKYLPWINLCGAIANIALNAYMIPRWHACGAAFASFLTQFFTNFILGFVLKPLQRNNQLLLRGLHPAFVKRELQILVRELLGKGK